VLLWPSLARAQLPPGKPPTIGYLGATTPQVERRQLEAFVQRLRDHGWIEARNVAIEQRWVEGRAERAAELANELARLKVDVIVTWGTANIVAATQATASIPVVFAAAADPVGTGLVASLARPGGNLTGLSIQAVDLAAKRL
jgi:putative ABC transport system substrate-binding protein